MEKIFIRPAKIKDLNTLLAFEQELIAFERPFDSTLQSGRIHYYDIEKMITASNIRLLVAQQNDEVIGSGYARIESAKPYLLHHQHAYLGFMFVRATHRGVSINKLIMDSLTAWVASKKITELRLDVYEPNHAAINAYQKSGFIKHMVEMRKGL